MKRILILLSLVLFLFGTSKTFAQPRFGVQAGLNFANMTISSDAASLSNKNKLGINLGVLADFSLSEKFAVQPGLLFSTKGYKNDEGGGTFRAAINYIEIPITAVYKVNFKDQDILLKAGPYLGYALSGKYKGDASGTISIGSGADKDLKPLDLGINVGVGYEVNQFIVTFQYGIGLANLAPVTDGGQKYKNMVGALNVAYFFGEK